LRTAIVTAIATTPMGRLPRDLLRRREAQLGVVPQHAAFDRQQNA
jgi:hypothetical protein